MGFTRISWTFVLVLALTSSAAWAQNRDLVFEDEAEEPKIATESDAPYETQAVVRLNATVELERNGEVRMVLPSETFYSGDKVRIAYVANVDAYAYWLAEGTTGEITMLFPNSKTGRNNFIKRNEENKIPSSGNFRFDDNPGTERLLLILSPEPIEELELAADEVAVRGGSPILNQNQADRVRERTEQHEEKSTNRDLVFEDEEEKDTGVITRTQVSRDIKQPFIAYWELRHE